MKKMFFIVLLFLAFGLCVFAGEKKMSAGLGLEWNMDSRHNFAGAAAFGFTYNLPRDTAIGLNVTGSYNFFAIEVLEASVLFRSYIQDNDYTKWFAQVDAGVFFLFEDEEITPMPLLGFRFGYRQPLGSLFYIEPYGRLGYPFAFGIGLIAGISF